MPGTAVREVTEAADEGGEVRLLLTVEEAAQRLAIGRSLMYELLATGRITSIRVGRLRRVPCEALADFVDGQPGWQAASPAALREAPTRPARPPTRRQA